MNITLRACFLAASWTWCIGMYLPVLLVGDFGWSAWFAFAIPNVIGAASVGFVLNGRRAGMFADKHEAVARLFSIVTILFHVSFLSWFTAWALSPFGSVAAAGPGVAVGALLVGAALARMRGRAWGALAAATLVFSVACFGLAWWASDGAAIALPPGAPEGTRAESSLWMAPSLAFGFLACPYLDLTILRTSAEAPGRDGRRVFLLGFGVFFLAMIVGSLFYANAIVTGWGFNLWIGAHMLAQSTFTMGAHLRELNERGYTFARAAGDAAFRRLASVGFFIALAVLTLSTAPARLHGWDRLVYDLFLSMYALVFPAYVWIVCVPRTRRKAPLATWIIAVALAAPLVWLGGIERQLPWLAIAIGVPLAAPAIWRAFGPSSPSAQAA